MTSFRFCRVPVKLLSVLPPAEKSNTKKAIGVGLFKLRNFHSKLLARRVSSCGAALSSSSLVFDVLLCGSNDIVKGGHEMSKFPIAPLEVTRFPCFVATPGDHALCLFTPRPRVVQLVELCCLSPALSRSTRAAGRRSGLVAILLCQNCLSTKLPRL
jgi:hypothetical protein